MLDYHRTRLSRDYLTSFLAARTPLPETPTPESITALRQMTSLPWQHGEPYVVAPAMTAIVAAAAEALDLVGEVLPNDIAPAAPDPLGDSPSSCDSFALPGLSQVA